MSHTHTYKQSHSLSLKTLLTAAALGAVSLSAPHTSIVLPPQAKAIPVVVTNDITPLQLAMDVVGHIEEVVQMFNQFQEAVKSVERADLMLAQMVANVGDVAHLVNQLADGGSINVMFNSSLFGELQNLDKEFDALANWEMEPWHVNTGVRGERSYKGYITIDDMIERFRKMNDIMEDKYAKHKESSDKAIKKSNANAISLGEEATEKDIAAKNLAVNASVAANTSAQYALAADKAQNENRKEREAIEKQRKTDVLASRENEAASRQNFDERGEEFIRDTRAKTVLGAGTNVKDVDISAPEIP